MDGGKEHEGGGEEEHSWPTELAFAVLEDCGAINQSEYRDATNRRSPCAVA